MAEERCLIIGAGNPDRGDDGVGRAVIAALRKRLGDRAAEGNPTLIEHGGEATSLVDVMQDFERVVIVDAADFDSKPGSYRRFEAGDAALPSELTELSSHGFGVPQAIELARVLGALPRRCSVYAIQAATFEAGASLSPGVADAVETVAEDIMTKILAVATREPSHA